MNDCVGRLDGLARYLDGRVRAFHERYPDRGYPARLDARAREHLLAYVALLLKWSRIYNLTAIRDPEAIIDTHLLDSLSLLPWLPKPTADRIDVIDMGSGAGLPVLPLAIVRPDLRYLSVESNGKKARFQTQVCLELDLSHVEVRAARIEDCQDVASFVTSRAFRAPARFLAHTHSHVLPGGRVVVMLARPDALSDVAPPAFTLEHVVDVSAGERAAPRWLAVYRRS